MKEIKVALVGFGGMARSHNAAYQALTASGYPIKLVAVCDCDREKFLGDMQINIRTQVIKLPDDIHIYYDVEDLIKNEDFDMADICLPSYLHKEYTIKLLRAGKHVMCEKPMALCGEDCEEMIAVAKEMDRKLMIAQCLRFEPSYLYLKECVEKGTFGKIKNLFMDRLSAFPKWGWQNWFGCTEKSGGCIMDMHIHDVDMARFLFGEPEAVSAVAYDDVVRWIVTNTRLMYKDLTVVINGSWDEAPGVPFTETFRARFEKASVIQDASGKVTVYPVDGEAFVPELLNQDRIAEEIRYLADTIFDAQKVNLTNPPESACATVKLVERLRESAAQNGAIVSL